MAILRGRDGTAYIVATTTVFTSAPTTGASGIYQVNTVGYRTWAPNTPIVVTATAGAIDSTWGLRGYDYFTGRVKVPNGGASTVVAISGAAVSTYTAVAQIYNWSLTIARNMADVTNLLDSWRNIEPLGLQSTVGISRFRTDTAFDAVASTPFVLLKLEESSGAGFWVMAHRTSLGWTKALGAVDQEALSFEAIGPVSRY